MSIIGNIQQRQATEEKAKAYDAMVARVQAQEQANRERQAMELGRERGLAEMYSAIPQMFGMNSYQRGY